MTMAHIHAGNATTNGVCRAGCPPASYLLPCAPAPMAGMPFMPCKVAPHHECASSLLPLLPGPPVVILVPVDGTEKVGLGLAGLLWAPAGQRVLQFRRRRLVPATLLVAPAPGEMCSH